MAKRNLVLLKDERIEGRKFSRGEKLATIDDKGTIGDVVEPLARGNIEARLRRNLIVADDTDEGKAAAEAHAKALEEIEKKAKKKAAGKGE